MRYVESPWIYKNKLEYREYQVRIARKTLSANTLIVLPTGLGKTAIAILSSALHLERDMNRKILVLAPTRPLVEQHRRTFLEFLKIGEDEMKVVTGEAKPEKRAEMYRRADIVFATPQTVKNDLERGRINPKDFQLIIVDEAHRAVGNYAYTYITRRFRLMNPLIRIIGLTASPSSKREKIEEIKKALGISVVEARSEEDEDVKPYVKGIKMDIIKVEIPPWLDAIRAYIKAIIDERMERLKKMGADIGKGRQSLLDLHRRLSQSDHPARFHAMSLVSEILKLDHALLMLESHSIEAFLGYAESLMQEGMKKQTRAAARLIREEKFIRAIELAKNLLEEGKEHPKIGKLLEMLRGYEGKVMIFTQYRATASIIRKHVTFMPSSIFIGKNKGMTQDEQKRILREFREGRIRCLISTSIGEEGLDIPEVDWVIFYEPVPSEIRFIQRRGRTGRKKEGKVSILVSKGTRDEAYLWSTFRKARKMKRILKSNERGLGKWLR